MAEQSISRRSLEIAQRWHDTNLLWPQNWLDIAVELDKLFAKDTTSIKMKGTTNNE